MCLDSRMIEILNYLKPLNRYNSIIRKVENSDPPNDPFIFEALFAFLFEKNGISLEYEVNVNPDNNTTVDFIYTKENRKKFCFELLSPDMSSDLKRQCAPEETEINGIHYYGGLLLSNNPNQHLKPQAQTIRMQEKILDKINKFHKPSKNIFSTIVVNCKNFHFGLFKEDDCRMVMSGRTKCEGFQEYWKNIDGLSEPIMGLLDAKNDRRGCLEFREKVTSVIFIPKISPELSFNLLEKAYIVLNDCRSNNHLTAFCNEMNEKELFRNLVRVR